MDYITPSSRYQVDFSCLDDLIAQNNTVRFIDAFVEKLDLGQLQYVHPSLKPEGRPPFHPKVLLKLYLYGYLHGVRSSRRLERECARNTEVIWLLQKLKPNYHTIADFRKNNHTALKNTFKLFVLFLKDMNLVSAHTVAIDGTKVRAHNSKKNNYNPKKIERHLEYIENKTNEYFEQLDYQDATENQTKVSQVAEKLQRLKASRINYEAIQQQLQQSGDPQISTTDADARALLVQGQVVEVCYNVQTAVDEKHKLVVATHTINRNDRNALYSIAAEAKANLQQSSITTISDKGYHNGSQLQQCSDNQITTICARQELVNSNEHGTTPDYIVTKFIYNPRQDTYTCPQGHTLKTQGTWHKKTRERDSYQFKKYRTPACKTCPAKQLCTGRQQGGREIERSQYAGAVEENKARYEKNTALYRTRQEINEHIFGTIKRKWGYYYTNLKGLQKVNGEFALIMTVYNIKRCFTILGFEALMKNLKSWEPDYKGVTYALSKTTSLHRLCATHFYLSKLAA